MSAPKLTPVPFLALGALLLQALPAMAQSTSANTPVQSFPVANVEVQIDGVKKMQSDRLFINARQCLGSKYGTEDTGGGDGDTDLDAGATAGDGAVAQNTAPLISKAVDSSNDSAEIIVTLSNLASTAAGGASFLEFWMGMQGQDCTQPAQRMSPNVSGGFPPCKKVGTTVQNIDTKKQVLKFTAQELFTDPYQSGLCDLQGIWTLYIVPLINETPAAGTPPMALGPTIFVRFEPDFEPLAPVTSVKGGRGETTVNVTWNMASGANQLTEYKIVFDPSSIAAAGAGSCTSGMLVEGQLLPADVSVLDERTTKALSYDVDPESLGLEFNQTIATAVVSLDQAGNESEVSNVVCVERVSTTGFWDSCGMNTKCRDSFTTCSVKLGDSGRGSWFGWSLGALGIALWLRRGASRARAHGRRTV